MKTKVKFLRYGLLVLILTSISCSKESEADSTLQKSQKEPGILNATDIERKSFSAVTPKDNRLILDVNI